MRRQECPNQAELRAYTLGDLAPPRLDEVADHLEECSHCEAAVRTCDHVTDTAITWLRGLAPSTDFSSPTPPPKPLAGQRVGDYEILGELGRGGMGVVYKARHLTLQRIVALKMLLTGPFASSEFRARFAAEAEAVARLQHPNIVQVYEVNEWQPEGVGSPIPYLALEYVAGGDLRDRTGGKPQAPAQAVAWVETLALAVQAAHEQGIIHRDLKPSNVLVTAEGTLKLCDFSVAKLSNHSGLRTASGLVVGTPEYMAPEQAGGQSRHIGPAADVYALGVILYELLAGRPPFQAASALDLLQQVRAQEPVSPGRLHAAIPRDLDTVCLKCLEKDPQRRYPSAAALAEDLRHYRTGRPVMARPVGRVTHAWRWCRREPGIATSLAALAGVIVVSLVLMASLWLQADQERQRAEFRAHLETLAREAAQQARAEADDHRRAARRNLYAANVRLAQEAWENGDPVHLRALLDEANRGQLGDEDLRGFEWHYLWRLGQSVGQTLKGHTDHVTCVAFHPGGRLLASGGEDATIRIWDVVRGQTVRVLGGNLGLARGVAFSPDGRWLASVDEGGTVSLWDAESGERIRFWSGQGGTGRAVAFAPDSKRLATAGGDGSVRIWTLEGIERATLRGHARAVPGVAFDPQGHQLASSGEDGLVRLWDLNKHQCASQLSGHVGPVQNVTYSPDGHLLATAGEDRTVRVWDRETGKLKQVMPGHLAPVRSVAFSCDGQRLASASDDRSVRLWVPSTGAPLLALHGHTHRTRGVAIHPDGWRLASVNYDQTVRLWDVASPREWHTLRGFHGPHRASAFLPDNQHLLALEDDGRLSLWAVATGECLRRSPSERGPLTALAVSPATGHLALGGVDGKIEIWEAVGERRRLTLTTNKGAVSALAFSQDGTLLASGGDDRIVSLWSAQSGKRLASFEGHKGPVRRLAFHPRERLIVSASSDETLRIWNIDNGKELRRLRGHVDYVTTVAFSPDGETLASGGYDQTVRLWDTQSGRERRVLAGHTNVVWAVSFSPDGRRLASTGRDQTVRLWEITSGKELLCLKGHQGEVLSVEFSPNGQYLATAGREGVVRLAEAVSASPELLRVREERDRAADLVASLRTRLGNPIDVLRELRNAANPAEALRRRALELVEKEDLLRSN